MKNSKILTIICFLPLIIGLGNNTVSKYCSGTIYEGNDQEDIVDLKIGRRNKDIVVYKMREPIPDSVEELTKYEIDLCKVKQIESYKKIIKIDDEDYIKIAIKNKRNQKITDCLISKKEIISGKSKQAGFDVFKPVDKIDKLVLHKCCTKEEQEDEIQGSDYEQDSEKK